ncbi:transcription initiation protein SPT3 homolog [Anthonomus grandis grandis]|uniref:transcription initiation protein SPT3 homolog n=1 Tax=Anthonomus grandis grandis TaxID=2921223 RepID=UPI0021662D80|nr:transcription initiation protein SPT3 homolog [Anthonomus grandis grandis]
MTTQKISYYNEISMMMYGFGDSHQPDKDTVNLVESIVLNQLQTIVKEAQKYGDGKIVNAQELVFLLRHNKCKMQRFVRYLNNKEITKVAYGSTTATPNFTPKIDETPFIEIDPEDRPKNKLIEFIELLDETGEFMDLSEEDEVKMERMVRADRISQELNEEKYIEFAKARCSSFKVKSRTMAENMKQWIDPKNETVINADALDVLSYFAHETVAEIVDCALLVREDAKSGTDPVRHLPGSYYSAVMFNGAHRFEEKKPDYTRVHSGQLPISVAEIHEVMRRIYNRQAGKLNFGGKVPETHFLFAL